MNGRSVILQASRKIPSAIGELLERNGRAAQSVKVFLMHQANQNLMDRVARALEVRRSPLLLQHPPLRQYIIGIHADRGRGMVARSRACGRRLDLFRRIRRGFPLGRLAGSGILIET